MIVLGGFMLVPGGAILVLVCLQIGDFLSTAIFHPDATLQVTDYMFFVLPSKDTFDNGMFFFNAIAGSLAWIAEAGFAATLLIAGWRMISTEQKARAEEEQAIERIKRSQQSAE